MQRRRKSSIRSMNKFIYVATEGRYTEKEYLNILKENYYQNLHIVPSSGNKSAPLYVLRKMKDYLKKKPAEPNDSMWILIDKDDWKDEDIQVLVNWERENPDQQKLSVSNPNIEFWLLLHFEPRERVGCPKASLTQLKNHLGGDYDKHISEKDFPLEKIRQAIKNAEICEKEAIKNAEIFGNQVWKIPRTTKMHQLVKEILDLGRATTTPSP